jgi:hypothetical protein
MDSNDADKYHLHRKSDLLLFAVLKKERRTVRVPVNADTIASTTITEEWNFLCIG